MADDIIEQITPHIHEILRIVLVKGRTLRELNELVGKTSKVELYSIILSTLRFRKH
jgi:hypothetical protein